MSSASGVIEEHHHRWVELGLALLTMVGGLVLFLHPLWRDGIGRAPGDWGDSRFIHYLLEHSWQWISRNPNHPLWDPPYYFPVEGVGAYTDLMAGAGPFYWIWRATGMAPGNAYVAWLFTIAVANILVSFFVFWKALRFSMFPAAAAATFLSIAAPLQNQLIHPQMLPQLYLMGAFGSMVMVVRESLSPVSSKRRFFWVILAMICFVLQMYTAFYYAWFLILAAGIALGWSVLFNRTQSNVLATLVLNWRNLIIVGILGALTLIPWIRHYLDAANLNHPLSFGQMHGWVPRWESWLYLGPDSPFYEWMLDWQQFVAIPVESNHEHRLGVGILTLVVISLGYLSERRHQWVQISALTAATLVLITTILPGGFTLWRYLYELLPGAPAARTLTRISLVVLIPMAIGVALVVQWLRSKTSILWALPLVGAVLVEQTIDYMTNSIGGGLDRAAAIAIEIPEGCSSFLYSPVLSGDELSDPTYVIQLDAMWAGMLADVPTVNAYGHIIPPGWNFGEPVIRSEEDQRRLLDAIEAWEASHASASEVCHLALDTLE